MMDSTHMVLFTPSPNLTERTAKALNKGVSMDGEE